MELFAPSLARAKRISSAATRAHDVGATSSLPPWHRSTAGGVRFPFSRSAFWKKPFLGSDDANASSVTSARRGRYPRRHSTPPSAGRHAALLAAAASASAAPWLKPARMTLPGRAPRLSRSASRPSTHRTAGSIPPHRHTLDPARPLPFPFAVDEGSATALHSTSLRWLSRGSNHAPTCRCTPPTTNGRTGAPGSTMSHPPGVPLTSNSANSRQCSASSLNPCRNTRVAFAATRASSSSWPLGWSQVVSRHRAVAGMATMPVSMRRLTRRSTLSTSLAVTDPTHGSHASDARVSSVPARHGAVARKPREVSRAWGKTRGGSRTAPTAPSRNDDLHAERHDTPPRHRRKACRRLAMCPCGVPSATR